MKQALQMQAKNFRALAVVLTGLLTVTGLQAGLFEDDEARKAILDLRQRVETIRSDADQGRKSVSDENAALGKSMLDLQRQIELLRTDIASLRGTNEQLARDLGEVQRQQKEQSKLLMDRVSRLEPTKVSVDGVEFFADPVERRDFESALAVFKKGDFAAAQNLFVGFIGRYPNSAYVTPALFWLGNAQYATRDYKEAIMNFRALVAKKPDHLRAPEAVLSVANCQLELKDIKGARKTLTDLIKAYPDSEAANAAKERLVALK
jgi:tol-pal system protein YbgF